MQAKDTDAFNGRVLGKPMSENAPNSSLDSNCQFKVGQNLRTAGRPVGKLARGADEPRHGYELIKAIEELTEGSYAPSPGTIYPTLSLLEDEGAIAPAPGDETRKAYQATDAGRSELAERADEVTALFERLSGHGTHRRAYATPEMFRAVGNLASVLKNRARSGKLDEDTVREIVDLVDDLAKKIERL